MTPGANRPTIVAVPPGCSMRKHCSAAAGLPMHSNEYSTPPCVISTTFATTSPSLARSTSVAPNFRASSSLPGTLSIAMIRSAPAMAAPLIVASPMPPQPTTATTEPAGTCAVRNTAPVPVMTAQPRRAARSRGMSWRIFTSALRCTSIFSANPDRLNTWLTGSPLIGQPPRLPRRLLDVGVCTEREAPPEALLARAAEHSERAYHMVAGLEIFHAGTDGFDDAGDLVTEDARQRKLAHAAHVVQVAVTQADGRRFQQDFVRARARRSSGPESPSALRTPPARQLS